jgi:hypothetical protein
LVIPKPQSPLVVQMASIDPDNLMEDNFLGPAAMVRVIAISISVVISFVLMTSDANAENCPNPCIEYEGTLELNAAWLRSSDENLSDSFEIYPKNELELHVKPIEDFTLNAKLVTEPVIDKEPGSNRFLQDVGTFVEDLYAQHDLGEASVFGGKFHPAFGRAWDITPGLHGTDLAEDYELVERVGGDGKYGFEAAGFDNSVEASIFTKDRTFLGRSLFTEREQVTLSDGGAGNTRGVSSVALSLTGCRGADSDACYEDGVFGYQAAMLYQKSGMGDDNSEFGILGGFNQTISLSEEAKVRLFAEAAYFVNFDGGPDDALFLTGSGEYDLGQLALSIAYTQERTLHTGEADEAEHLIDLSAIYELNESLTIAGERWSLGAGASIDHIDNEDTETIVGLRMGATFDGSNEL